MEFNVLKHLKKDSDVLQQKINFLESQMTAATAFVREIEKGNLEVEYNIHGLEGEDVHALASSLISLRNQLKNYALQEKERSWVSEGLAKFIEILRSRNNDMSSLTDSILRNLVKYLEANQGALYIINDQDPQDIHLKMVACFAYDRKKYIDKRIEIGQGIVGQVVLEKESVFMTDIPDDFFQITSGLGHATPRNLLIVPLKIDEKVLGVIEIATFNQIKKYHIDFVERLGESIASTISNVNISEQTKKLLHETQMQTEYMRSQEEEMRQSMEELSATQDEMHKVLREAQEKEIYMYNLVNASTDSIISIDRNYKVVMINTTVIQMMQSQGIEAVKGMDIKELSKKESWEKDQVNFKKAFLGETVETRDEYNGYYFHSIYQPLKDVSGEVTGILLISRNITKDVQLQNQTEELLKAEQARMEELSAQEEELRQNMEELSATQEEMQRILEEVQEKERYLNELINVSNDSIFTVDRDYRLISANKVLSGAIFALGIKDVKGFDMLSFYPDPVAKSNYQALFDRAFAGEYFEYTNEHSQGGHTSYYTTNFAPLTNSKGEIYAVASFAKDTTQILTVLKEAQEKERYLNELINVPQDGIYTVDKEYKIISANKVLASNIEALGLDVKGFDILSFYPDPVAKSNYKALFDRAFAGENFEHTYEHTQNDHTSYFTTNFAPLTNMHGEIYAVASFAKNTTNVMAAMKELHEKERYLDELINVPKDSIFTLDRNYKIVSANKALTSGLAGMGIDKVTGFDMLSLYQDEESRNAYKTLIDRAFEGENFEHTNQFAMEGHISYYTTNYAPLRNSNGEIFAVASFAKDTTAIIAAQKEAEQMTEEIRSQEEELRQNLEELCTSQEDMQRLLKESQEKEHYLEELINVSMDSIMTIDKNFKIISCNKALVDQYLALGVEGFGKGSDPLSILPEDQKKHQLALFKRVFRGETVNMTQQFTVQGVTTHIQMLIHPLQDQTRGIFAAALISRDITETVNNRKRLEELLKDPGNKAH